MRILLTGGGTGGHLYPLLSVAKAIKEQSKEPIEFLYLGPCNDLSEKILKSQGIPTGNLIVGKWRRYFSFNNFIDAIKVPVGILQALIKVLFFMPDVVFSKGGYGSVPAVVASRLYWIPVVIHESDAVPGRANRFMEHMADVVAISYEMTEGYTNPTKTYFTGNPVKTDILNGSLEESRKKLGISGHKPVLLVLGGSQGSRKINTVITQILPRLLETYEVIHQSGEKNFDETKELAGKAGIKPGREGYQLFPYLGDSLKDAFTVADLILSRAGATTIAEIAALGKPCILVPLINSANDHQLHNGFEVAKKGGAMVLKEENLTPELLLGKIDILMNDLPLRQSMGEKIKYFYNSDASAKIADVVIKLGLKEKLRD